MGTVIVTKMQSCIRGQNIAGSYVSYGVLAAAANGKVEVVLMCKDANGKTVKDISYNYVPKRNLEQNILTNLQNGLKRVKMNRGKMNDLIVCDKDKDISYDVVLQKLKEIESSDETIEIECSSDLLMKWKVVNCTECDYFTDFDAYTKNPKKNYKIWL